VTISFDMANHSSINVCKKKSTKDQKKGQGSTGEKGGFQVRDVGLSWEKKGGGGVKAINKGISRGTRELLSTESKSRQLRKDSGGVREHRSTSTFM